MFNLAHRSLEVGSTRPSPGSVGKLRISNEMKHKLELVTANHSLRSTGKPRPTAIPNMQSGQTGKLDSDRRLLLQQQLGKFIDSYRTTTLPVISVRNILFLYRILVVQ